MIEQNKSINPRDNNSDLHKKLFTQTKLLYRYKAP